MSGGSYNYLYFRSGDELFERVGDIKAMQERLAGLGYAEDAAAEVEEILLILNQTRIRLNTRMRRLEGVMRAVEWKDSGDSGEDAIKEALKKYRES